MRFTIPTNTPERACKSCKAPVYWIFVVRADGCLTVGGPPADALVSNKRMPVNHDGTSHFATCPDAATHRKPRAKPRPKKAEQLDLLGRK